jgi:hypothetical protein
MQVVFENHFVSEKVSCSAIERLRVVRGKTFPGQPYMNP